MSDRDPYFAALESALKHVGVIQPVLVIDLDRVDANIDVLLKHLPPDMGYRVVAKSLPVPRLIEHVRARTQTGRVMTFNLPMLIAIAQSMPDVDQLLGKPLPAGALQQLLDATGRDACDRVYWLIDTQERLADYATAAAANDVQLNIVLEIDVGLHRGGFVAGETFDKALTALRDNERLNFAGLMGYEPHVTSLPRAFGWQSSALAQARTAYLAATQQASQTFGAEDVAQRIRNAGGSPTYRLHRDTEVANEVSVGSVLVKPTDFDQPLLVEHRPASFIATPVIKASGPTQLPGFGWANNVLRRMLPGSASSCFIHGGHWLADPVDPPGLRYNRVFGRSSNQEMVSAPWETHLAVGDFVFFRPHQSEAVFLQFGDVALYRDGAIVDWWPTFPVSA